MIWKRLKDWLIPSQKRRYYVVIAQSRYVQEEVGMETVVCGYLFQNRYDAAQHYEDIRANNKSYVPLGIVELETDLDVTIAKLDYARTKEHPHPTVRFLSEEWM